MNASNYGAMGSATYDPKQFVLKALKKISLNNKNAVKFIELDNVVGIKERMINSIHLLEELDMMLNRDVQNSAVDRVSMHYQWIIKDFEEILDDLDNEKFNKTRYAEIFKLAEIDITAIYQGFFGMKDDYDTLDRDD